MTFDPHNLETPDYQGDLEKAIQFAGGYVPRNPEVFDVMRKGFESPLPPTATHAEYAYREGQRALVAMLYRQYKLATTGKME